MASNIDDLEYGYHQSVYDLMDSGMHNPGIHEYMEAEAHRSRSGFGRVLMVGAVMVAGVLGVNHLKSTEGESVMPGEAVPTMPGQPIAPEVATPEIAAINSALAEIKLDQTNSLDNLVEAIKAADAAFAPTDLDRMPNMPAGYVKMLLPHEATGIMIPYTIAERTADKERYTSPEAAAGMYAAAKLYQDLTYTKYPHLQGEMLRLRDFNGPAHKTHNNGLQVDISGAFGWGITQYSNGSLADQQFSDRYSREFTIDMFSELSQLTVGGAPAISSILYGDSSLNKEVNNRVGRYFMQYKDDHLDHGHATFATQQLERWRPRIGELPWSEDQDLRIAGLAQPISPEQHASQHQDFELWILGRLKYMEQFSAQDNLTAPEGFKVEALTPEAEAHIAGLAISEDRKEFLRKMVPSITTVYRAGAKINPTVVLAQTTLETGFGHDLLSQEVNNFFGMKAGGKWSGDVFVAGTREEYRAGEVDQIQGGFRVYPNAASSVADYARLIQNAPHYADAAQNFQSIEGYTNGLFNEVDSQGNIIREQGEPGVLSYGTDRGYEQKVFTAIDTYGYQALIDAQINGTA